MMERTIYLLRHGEPEKKEDESRCISRTDLKLSARGRRQAKEAGRWLADKGIQRIYTSPLFRCVETAEIVRGQVIKENKCVGRRNSGYEEEIRICKDLEEVSVGEWENRLFSEIQAHDPVEYEKRGRQIGSYAPPGGESFAEAGRRFEKCLEQICRECEGNILVVGHRGIVRGYLCRVLKISADRVFELPQPYSGVTALSEKLENGKKERSVLWIGRRPASFLDEEEMLYLYRKCRTPEQVIRHMRAVAGYIEDILEQLPASCFGVSERELLLKAALVHDIARTESNHALKGAALLQKEGYPEIAQLVRNHHGQDLVCRGGRLTAAEVLFYADKRVWGERIVTIEERFERSRGKCRTPEALENHEKQFELAKMIDKKFSNYTRR